MKACPTAVFALVFLVFALQSRGEAPTIDHGSFLSPDGRFSLEFGGFVDRDFQYAMKNRRTGEVKRLAEPDYDLWGPLYSVKWTRDSTSVLLIYHIADGSEATVLHFDGKSWRLLGIDPSPVDSKCPQDETIENGVKSWNPSYFATVFDHKTGKHEVWLSYGVQTDESRRHSRFYVCNFNYDPVTTKLSHVELRQVSIPTFVRLKMRHDYSESPYPKVAPPY
jgi:hypothetical protein